MQENGGFEVLIAGLSRPCSEVSKGMDAVPKRPLNVAAEGPTDAVLSIPATLRASAGGLS